MSTVCNTALSNLGSGDCKLNMSEMRRIVFVSKNKESGALNYIAQADAATLTNWQTLFDKYAFSSSVLEKAVPTTWLWKLLNEQGDPVTYDEDGDYVKLRDGDYTVSFELHEEVPEYVGALKEMEENTLCVYLYDVAASGLARVWGIKDGTDLYPFEITGLQVPNFNLKTSEAISSELIKFRVKFPKKMNALTSVEILLSDLTDDTDFYSLVDAAQVISTPAVTGCITVIDTDRYDEAVTGIAYTAFDFIDAADDSSVTLAAAGSVTESPNGTYTINEAALLTTGHTYSLQISHSGYDIAVADVVVP